MAAILRDARKRKKLTQAQVGEAVGRDQATVSKWENGDFVPDRDVAPKYAEVIGLSLVQVLYPDGSQTPADAAA